eukprot:3021931-Pyramimonas_sp.AAC.1
MPPREKRALRGVCSGAHWCQYRVSKSFNGELSAGGAPKEPHSAVKRMKQAPEALQTIFCRGLLPDPAQAFAYPSRNPARHFHDMGRKGVVLVEGGFVFTGGN